MKVVLLAHQVEIRRFDLNRRFLFPENLHASDRSWFGFMDQDAAVSNA